MNERKRRQSEVSKEGKRTEEEVVKLLNSVEGIEKFLIIERCQKLFQRVRELIRKGELPPSAGKKIYETLEELKIFYPCGKTYFSIDADVCVVDKRTLKLLAVISVKKSFRERGGQTAYWALKLKREGKSFKYVLATPDVDKEIFNPLRPHAKRKWKIILSCELEKVFVYSYEGKVYKKGNLFVGKDYLLEWIAELIDKND